MKPTVTPFTAIYTQWLDSFRALIPGMSEGPSEKLSAKPAAIQEWEDEGGSIKPVPSKPGVEPAPKIPF
jgi:hypothetical protein